MGKGFHSSILMVGEGGQVLRYPIIGVCEFTNFIILHFVLKQMLFIQDVMLHANDLGV